MELDAALLLPERRSSTYLYVTDAQGDMLVGISDMDITACITPAALEASLGRINASDGVVVDANLSEETLRWLGEHVSAPLYADTVSTAKAPRLRHMLGKLRALKPNLLEAAALTGESSPEAALTALLELGVRRVFLSLGADGMLVGEGNTRLTLPCENGPVVNTTGAGDAALDALVWADLGGCDLRACAEAALRAGAITCSCEETNHPNLKQLMGV
jgi:pseudouridine kinase